MISGVSHPGRLFQRLFNKKSITNYIIIAVCSAGLVVGMNYYTPSIDKLRAEAIYSIDHMNTKYYFKEDIPAVNKVKDKYQNKIKKAYLKQDMHKISKEFNTAISSVKSRPELIADYIGKLKALKTEIYSDENKESAKAIISDFKRGSKGDYTKKELKARYDSAAGQIGEFKTVTEHKEEEALKAKIAARWQIKGSSEYPFKLSDDLSFIMPIDMGDSHGYLTGKWEVEKKTVIIHILKNTVDESYKPYDWVFNYNEEADTLTGTGQFAGWNYTKY